MQLSFALFDIVCVQRLFVGSENESVKPRATSITRPVCFSLGRWIVWQEATEMGDLGDRSKGSPRLAYPTLHGRGSTGDVECG